MIKGIVKRIKSHFQTPVEYARSLGVKVGNHCYISTRGFSSEGYLIEIGDYVRIASNTTFYTHGGIWPIRFIYNDPNVDIFGKIKVGSYTSIGANCMIMPGVTIGERCVVGGGSVVTKSVPDGCMVAGNPARIIGHTDDFYQRAKKIDFGTKEMSHEKKREVLLNAPDDHFITKGYMKEPEKK